MSRLRLRSDTLRPRSRVQLCGHPQRQAAHWERWENNTYKVFFFSPFQGFSLLSSRSNPHTRIKDIITLYYLLGGQAPTRCWCYVMLCERLKSQELLTKNNHRRLTMWSLPETDKLTLIRLASLQQEAFQIRQRFQSAFSLSGVTQAGSASPRRRGKHRKWQQRPAAANKVSGNAAQAAVSPELNFLY